MKKVLLVSCDSLGKAGVQAVMMDLVRFFSNEYQFDVIISTKDAGYYESEFKSYGGYIFKILPYSGKSRLIRAAYMLFGDIFRQLKLYKLIKNNGPYDIIHCHNGFQAGWCIIVAKIAGVKKRITHIHDAFPSAPYFVINLKRKLYSKLILKYSTEIIACSEEAGKSVLKNGEYRVITNPYDEIKFKYTNDNTNNRTLTLIQVGSFSEKKNQLFSIQLLQEIQKDFLEAKLVLVGFDNNSYLTKMNEAISELRLESSVTIYPPDADIPSLMRNATFFLMPSKYEGFGIVLIEAQSIGLHCFVSDTVSKESNAGGCTYLPLGELSKWKDSIIEMYNKNGNKKSIYDCSPFSKNQVMRQYETLYNSNNLSE